MTTQPNFLNVITKLFDEYLLIKNAKLLDKIVTLSTDLCFGSMYPINDKFTLFEELLRYEIKLNPDIDPESTANLNLTLTSDILSRWRDSLLFLKGLEMDVMISLLTKVMGSKYLSSHERISTAVNMYNNGFVAVCYRCFEILVFEETMEFKHKLEAIKFLYAADNEEREIALKALLIIIVDKKYKCEDRYKAIFPYVSKSGLVTLMNFSKLKILYDENFVYNLQIVYFRDVDNEIRYRILSGQILLQMKNLIIETRQEVIKYLFDISNNKQNNFVDENIRADAADIILRLGNSTEKIEIREILGKMGFSSDNTRKKIGIKTIYDNSQNIHNEAIDKCVQHYLEKMLSNHTDCDILSLDQVSRETINKNGGFAYRLKNYETVSDEISSHIRSLVGTEITAYQRNSAYKALERIKIDTATFTKYNATLAEILVHIWSRIHSGEFDETITKLLEKRMVEELTDMDDNCSSGHAGRFVNVLSYVDDTIKIDWIDQLKSNVSGRMNAKIRDCQDLNIQTSIILGMIEGADESDKVIYLNFAKENLSILRNELQQEFVDAGYLKIEIFDDYMTQIIDGWLQ